MARQRPRDCERGQPGETGEMPAQRGVVEPARRADLRGDLTEHDPRQPHGRREEQHERAQRGRIGARRPGSDEDPERSHHHQVQRTLGELERAQRVGLALDRDDTVDAGHEDRHGSDQHGGRQPGPCQRQDRGLRSQRGRHGRGGVEILGAVAALAAGGEAGHEEHPDRAEGREAAAREPEETVAAVVDPCRSEREQRQPDRQRHTQHEQRMRQHAPALDASERPAHRALRSG